MRDFSQKFKPLPKLGVAIVLALALIAQPMYILALATNVSALSASDVVYDALPSVSPERNYPSHAFAATSTSEFGDAVHLAGSNRKLSTVTLTMSTWAKYSEYSSNPTYSGNESSWTLPATLNIYSNEFDGSGTPTTKLASVTKSISVPWRPEADPTCPDTGYGAGFAWRNSEGVCYNGFAFNAEFDLGSSNVVVPDDIVVSLAFNTQTHGYAPTGVPGPYNSLNVAMPQGQTVSAGSDNSTDVVLVNSTWSGAYGDGGSTGVFRKATDWSPYGTMAMQITAAAPLTIAACTTVSTLNSTSLSAWDRSETRATGHNALMASGLHIWTEGATSTDKAAGYYGVNFPLVNLGSQTIAESIDYEAAVGITPGLQLAMDFDNNGSFDGYLVGEAIYGNNWWLSNSAAQFAKDGAPNTGGGNGSNWFGTASEWLNAFPDAQVRAIGYSLGSGVHGNGILKRITLGCTNYTFGLAAPANLTPADGTVTNDPAFVDTWSVVEGAAGYEYRTANVLDGSDLGPVIYSDSTTTQPGRYSTSGSTVTRQNGGTPDGDYYWQVRAVDSAGNPGPWSVIHKVSVDATAPGVPTLQTPANGAVINYNSFWFDWSDVTGASGYEFQASQSSATDLQGSLTSNVWHGDASGTEPVDSRAWSSGASGTWYWQVRAVDAAGNKSAWTPVWSITIDMTAPAVPSNLSWVGSNNQSAQNGFTNIQKGTLSWEDTTPSDVDHYVYRFWTNISGYYDGQENAWSTSDSQYITTTLTGGSIWTDFADKEGTYYFCIEAVDLAGNTSGCSNALAITYDKTAPAAPTNLAWTTSTGTAVANGGTTDDESGVASWSASTSSDVDHYIYKYWNDIVGNQYKVGSEYVASPINGVSLPGVFNQGEGVHYFSVAAVDHAGNVSAFSAPFEITYDQTPTTETPETPANNSNGNGGNVLGVATTSGSPANTTTGTNGTNSTEGAGETTNEEAAATGEVLAAENTKAFAATTGEDTESDTAKDDSANAGKLFGMKWFWWLLILAVLAGLWWFAAMWRSRKDEEN